MAQLCSPSKETCQPFTFRDGVLLLVECPEQSVYGLGFRSKVSGLGLRV